MSTAAKTNTSTLKPALRVSPPKRRDSVTMSLPLPPSDLTSLVAAAIRARPSPRRNCHDFYFCDTTSKPVAPPPTPTNGLADVTPLDGPDDTSLTPRSMASAGSSASLATMASSRTSEDGRRSMERKVRFE